MKSAGHNFVNDIAVKRQIDSKRQLENNIKKILDEILGVINDCEREDVEMIGNNDNN